LDAIERRRYLEHCFVVRAKYSDNGSCMWPSNSKKFQQSAYLHLHSRRRGKRRGGGKEGGESLYPAACVWLCGENNLENDKGYKPENGNGGGGEQWVN